MQFQNLRSQTHQSIRLSLLVTIGLIIFIFEDYLPRPFPWAKPGLANIAGVLALYWFSLPAALLVTILRVILGALLMGTLFNPTFILSLGGGLSAVLAMGLFRFLGRRFFSMIGISVIGAFFHILAQFLLAVFFIIHQTEIFYFLPIMLITSLVTGLFVGIISLLLDQRLGGSGCLKDTT